LKNVTKLAKYNLNLQGVRVRWDTWHWTSAWFYTLSHWKGPDSHNLGMFFFIQRGNRSAVKRKIVIDRMLYWCDVLNVHVWTKDKSCDKKDTICEKVEHVFDQFPLFHM